MSSVTTSLFQQLLAKFLEDDHQVFDDTCLEKLLTHLASRDGDQVHHLLQLPDCQNFCERSIKAFEKGLVDESLLSFSLRLQGLVIGCESNFSSEELQQVTMNIVESPRFHITSNPSIQCAFVKMLTHLLSHETGIEWLSKSDAWKKIQILHEKSHSIYVTRECQHFLSTFVFRLKDATAQREILEKSLRAISSDSNSTFDVNLDLITKVLETAFKENNDSIVEEIADEINKSLSSLPPTLNSNRLLRMARLQVLLSFLCTEPDELEGKIVDIITRLLHVKNVPAVIATLLQCQNDFVIFKSHDKTVLKLDDDLLYLQLMPVLYGTTMEDNSAKSFLDKLRSEINSPLIKLLGEELRCFVATCDDADLLVSRSINCLMQMKDIMSQEMGVITFRTLLYVIIKFSESSMIKAQSSALLGITLDAILRLIDHFHLDFQHISNTCLLSHMQELLLNPDLPQRQVSQVLRVMCRVVSMNFVPTTDLQTLGPQLFRNLHAITWEVRDSTLEVLSSMAKVLAYHELLLQHNLCPQVVCMATGDEESYVRVSAFCCLTGMVAVDTFWEKCLKNERLTENLTSILCHESEGIVRSEAAALANAMLCYKRYSLEERERIINLMSTVTVKDLHWEVKLNALKFWDTFIGQKMKQDQIPIASYAALVTVDEEEVQRRLRGLFSELSRTRCLAVLISTLHDPDLQVARKAMEILCQLQNLLRDHGMLKELPKEQLPEAEVLDLAPENHSNGAVKEQVSEDVISDIISQSDLSLLASVCQSQLNLDTNKHPSIEEPHVLPIMSEDQFVSLLAGLDLEKEVESRARWIEQYSEHLDSLLADMLESREFVHNTNDMDCY